MEIEDVASCSSKALPLKRLEQISVCQYFKIVPWKQTIIIRFICKSKEIQSCCAALADATASPAEVASAESKNLVKMYGGRPDDTLNSHRFIKYMEYATSTKELQPVCKEFLDNGIETR